MTQVSATEFIHTTARSRSLPWPATLVAQFGGVWFLSLTLLAGAISVMLASAAFAGDPSALKPTAYQTLKNDSSTSGMSSDQHTAVTPGMAAASALKQFNGRILNIRLEQDSSGPYYRVRLLHNGQVQAVDIKAVK